MLEAVKRLRHEGIPVRWEVVGPVNERKCRLRLDEARQSLGDDVVRLRGRLKQLAGWDLIARCHVGFALMHPHTNYFGSYPTKMFEYMALGVPVVASDFPLYRKIVETEGCGICVDPTDSAAVASAVGQIVDQPTLAREMGERGREAIKCRYNWSSEEIRLLDLYASVLPGG